MRNLFIYLLILVATINAFSQFSINTELKYLQIVNNQENKDLISDNLTNAELLVDSLLLSNENSRIKSEFLYELSKSYYFVGKYDLSFFTILRQRCIFPNKIIQKQSETLFIEAAYSNNLSDSLTQVINKKTSFINIPNETNKKFNLLLELSIIINTKKISNYIYRTGLVYRSIETNIPIWYQHWEYLTIIKLKPKKINEALKFSKSEEYIYKQIKDEKLKYKIYRKSIKHYRKHKSHKTAKAILDEYKEFKLGFFLRIDAMFKSILL